MVIGLLKKKKVLLERNINGNYVTEQNMSSFFLRLENDRKTSMKHNIISLKCLYFTLGNIK